MNALHVGLNTKIAPPSGGFLMITDDVPDVPKAKVFDPREHSFNPLHKLDYRKARDIAEIVYTVYPQGENTLTVRNGKRALMKMLMEKPKRLDELPRDFPKTDVGPLEAVATVDDLLVSPVLRRVFCERTNFSFKKSARIVARLNRAELGDFDCLVIGLFLMAQYPGQLVIKDLAHYGRDYHVRYVREKRLIAACSFLKEIPERLRNSLLLEETVPSRTTAEDAETLARYAGFMPKTTGYNDFVKGAMA